MVDLNLHPPGFKTNSLFKIHNVLHCLNGADLGLSQSQLAPAGFLIVDNVLLVSTSLITSGRYPSVHLQTCTYIVCCFRVRLHLFSLARVRSIYIDICFVSFSRKEAYFLPHPKALLLFGQHYRDSKSQTQQGDILEIEKS